MVRAAYRAPIRQVRRTQNVVVCALAIGALLWIDLPRLKGFFEPGATF